MRSNSLYHSHDRVEGGNTQSWGILLVVGILERIGECLFLLLMIMFFNFNKVISDDNQTHTYLGLALSL